MEERETFEVHGRRFCFRGAPHLWSGSDWHDAYVSIVDCMLEPKRAPDMPSELPAYPLLFDVPANTLLYELGAYWEGALYFLWRVGSGAPLLEELLSMEKSDAMRESSLTSTLFDRVWNSHGQAKWLKAHLIRADAQEREFLPAVPRGGGNFTPRELRAAARQAKYPALTWLAAFTEQHAIEGTTYPNPYFGGNNPLHLGLILSGLGNVDPGILRSIRL